MTENNRDCGFCKNGTDPKTSSAGNSTSLRCVAKSVAVRLVAAWAVNKEIRL